MRRLAELGCTIMAAWLTVAAVPGPTIAQTAPAVPADAGTQAISLTLAAARALALKAHPGVRGAAAALAAARAAQGEARAARGPQLDLAARYGRLSDVPAPAVEVPTAAGAQRVQIAPVVLNESALTASVTAPLYTGGRLAHAEAAARAAAGAAAIDAETAGRDVALAVARAYWQIFAARAQARAVDETVRLVTAMRQDARRLRTAGMIADADVLAVEVRLSEARMRRLQARHAALQAQASLASLLSLPLETRIELADEPPAAGAEPAPLDSLTAAARQTRTEPAALTARVQAAEARVAAERGGRWPSLSLQADWSVARPNPRYFPAEDAWHDGWRVGVGARWALWDGGVVRQRVRRAEAEARGLAARRQQALDGVELEVFRARQRTLETGQRIELAATTLAQAAEHERNLRERFTAGTATSTQVLDAEVALEAARIGVEQARADAALARAEMAHAAGSVPR